MRPRGRANIPAMLRYKLLGNSGVRVSQICLGTMSFGDAWGFGADEATSHSVIAAFAERGGNFIDTANKYHDGHTEEIVGKAIGANRDRWVLATKYTLSMAANDPNASGNSRKNMMRSVEASLRRLGTDYIDLLWVHAWDFTTPAAEVMRGLDDLVRSGKVHYVGISDAPAWVVARANTLAELRGWTPFVGLQVPYSLIERTVERELLPMARAFGMAATTWAPIHAGVLTGKYTRGDGKPTDSKRAAVNDSRLTERNLAIARVVDAVADELGVTSAKVAMAWVMSRGDNVIPIVGPRKVEQIEDLVGAVDVELTPAQRARLDEASKIELGFPHDFTDSESIRKILYGDAFDRIDLPKR